MKSIYKSITIRDVASLILPLFRFPYYPLEGARVAPLWCSTPRRDIQRQLLLISQYISAGVHGLYYPLRLFYEIRRQRKSDELLYWLWAPTIIVCCKHTAIISYLWSWLWFIFWELAVIAYIESVDYSKQYSLQYYCLRLPQTNMNINWSSLSKRTLVRTPITQNRWFITLNFKYFKQNQLNLRQKSKHMNVL